MKKVVVDIDRTICTQESNYNYAKPFPDRIAKINKLYDDGIYVCYQTARGTETGIDWRRVTEDQLKLWGAKHNELLFGKPAADMYIDDKSFSADMLDEVEMITNKKWGYEILLQVTDKYAVKRLVLTEGNSIHLQFHSIKDETWYILKGSGCARIGDNEFWVYPGSVVHIPAGKVHKVTANKYLEILETSTPELDDLHHLD